MNEFAQQPEPNLARLAGGLQRTGLGFRAFQLQGFRLRFLFVQVFAHCCQVPEWNGGLRALAVAWQFIGVLPIVSYKLRLLLPSLLLLMSICRLASSLWTNLIAAASSNVAFKLVVAIRVA